LTVGRLETGSLKLDPKPLDILPVLEEAVSTVYPMAAYKGIHIQKDIGEDLHDVISEKGGLEQVLQIY
jgi:signal transduction histidine kinase